MAQYLGLDSDVRLHRVLTPSVPHWSAAEQSLATFRMAQCCPHFNGSDFDGYLTQCRPRYPGPSGKGRISLPNPLGVEGLPNLYLPVQTLVLALGLVAAASVVVGRRGARGVERQQIKWLLYAGTIFFVGNFLKNTVFSPLAEVSWGLWIGYLLVGMGGLGGPIAIGIAILRYRLYEIDTLINRTLVYGALTAILATLYFGGIVVLQRVFVAFTGEQSTLAVVASTLVIAALFNPLRRRVQAFVDRRFYRRKYDAAKTLEAFSAKLRDETDLDALSDDLVGVVRETMQPAH